MARLSQNLPDERAAQEKSSVLVVSPFVEDQMWLRSMLGHLGCEVACCRTLAEAELYTERNSIAVILSERDLPDGNWKGVLRHTEGLKVAPMLLVISRQADESLWGEVLNLGGFDVLLKPLEAPEVTRVVAMALRSFARGPRAMSPQFA